MTTRKLRPLLSDSATHRVFEEDTMTENTAKHTPERRFCYYNVDGFIVQVQEGVEGYRSDTRNLDATPERLDRMNAGLGLSPEDVTEIVASSMFPKSDAGVRARQKYGE